MTTMGLGLLIRVSFIPRTKTWGREEAGEPKWPLALSGAGLASLPAIFLSKDGLISASIPLHLASTLIRCRSWLDLNLSFLGNLKTGRERRGV